MSLAAQIAKSVKPGHPGVTLGLHVKNFFFNPGVVMDGISKEKRKSLSRAGAFIRKRGRSLLKRRKKVSEPGNPPSVHSTDENATLKKILFAFDAKIQGVVVGPVALNTANETQGYNQAGIIPGVLEHGGEMSVLEEWLDLTFLNNSRFKSHWQRVDLRRKPRPDEEPRLQRRRRIKIAARPWMNPALAMESKAGTLQEAFYSRRAA